MFVGWRIKRPRYLSRARAPVWALPQRKRESGQGSRVPALCRSSGHTDVGPESGGPLRTRESRLVPAGTDETNVGVHLLESSVTVSITPVVVVRRPCYVTHCGNSRWH